MQLTAVLKQSKFCNLRCVYCYEFEYLADVSVIKSGDYAKIYEFLDCYYSANPCRVNFCWHGGEPILRRPNYYIDAIEGRASYSWNRNAADVIQTNLSTKINLDLLEIFDHISISFDPFGSDRVDLSGRDTRERVLRNMVHLAEKRIPFSCISVVNSHSVIDLENTYNFFNDSGINFRLLPYYKKYNDLQAENFKLGVDEISDVFKRAVNLIARGGCNVVIYPIDGFFSTALRHIRKKKVRRYEKRQFENVLIFETNGDIYSQGTAGDRKYLYGNVFSQTYSQIMNSDGRARAVARAEDGMKTVCEHCEFFGACNGWYLAEGSDLETASVTVCPARGAVADAVALLKGEIGRLVSDQ